MYSVIDPGRERQTLTMTDDVCYSHVKDMENNPLDLTMSLLTIRRPPRRSDQSLTPKAPVIVWVNGRGWRTPYASRNMMVPELVFLADQGYLVANVYYRSSDQGKFPAQVVDIKTAIRFLRANADKYGIDAEQIGIFGRSAGGHLASFVAMNTDDFISEEWSGFSSRVQAACEMFGPVDMETTVLENMKKVKDPNYRWHSMEETYDARLLGWEGSVDALLEKAKIASPINYINDNMCDILIMHGDSDDSVPLSISERFYKKLVAEGKEQHADFYVLTHGGHGTPEFYQESVRKIITEFFNEHLRNF